MKTIKNSTYLKLFSWTLVVVWMTVIFLFSGQDANASSQTSGVLSETVVEIVEETFPSADISEDTFEITLRNVAHFLLFFILGILVFNAVFLYEFSRIQAVGLSVLIAVLYALTDEWHQFYVPGRAFELFDLLIDSFGAITGTLFILFFVRNRKRMINEN